MLLSQYNQIKKYEAMNDDFSLNFLKVFETITKTRFIKV